METFEDLKVWQKSMLVAKSVYEITQQFPQRHHYTLGQQLERASISVPSNIAEGYGRHTTADYIRFLSIARGSVNEIITQLMLTEMMGITKVELKPLIEQCYELRRMLNSMISTLERKIR